MSPVDEVHGVQYFDDRDVIGFVGGAPNRAGRATDHQGARTVGHGDQLPKPAAPLQERDVEDHSVRGRRCRRCGDRHLRGLASLYFYRGRELDDGSGLLEGGGKAMRFIRLRTPADAESAATKQLLRKAFRLGG